MTVAWALMRTHLFGAGAALVLVCALIPHANAQSTGPDLIYSASVPVSSQSRAQRKRAAGAALLEVLIKASGNRAVGEYPGVQKQLKRADGLIQRFQYVDSKNNLIEGSGKDIVIWFDPGFVQGIMRAEGIELWIEDRQDVVIWGIIQERRDRRWLSAEETDLGRALEITASNRGLPALLPLMDLEDQGKVSLAEAWGGFGRRLGPASQRYSTRVYALVRLSQMTRGWLARWTLYDGEQETQWRYHSRSSEEGLRLGLNAIADRLALANSVSLSGDAGHRVSLRVGGVESFVDYNRTRRYFLAMSQVDEVEIVGIWREYVEFNILTRDKISRLLDRVDRDRVLLRDESAENPFAANRHFYLRLAP